MKAKQLFGIAVLLAICAALLGAAPQSDQSPSSAPRYTADGKLMRPEGYREWVYLSSGLGMNYSPGPGGDEHPMFTNVFVPQAAYKQFVATGKWPDKTVFVVEERGSSSNGSINKKGRFQTDFMGIGVEVKDESRPEKWAYFTFDDKSASSAAAPKDRCWQCHEDHAAVEHTFVQFYPTLKPIANKFGVYKKSAEDVK